MSSLHDFYKEIAESSIKSPEGSTPSSYDNSKDGVLTPATDAEAEAEAEKCSQAFLSIYSKLQRQIQETNAARERVKVADRETEHFRRIAEMAEHVYEPAKRELDRAREFKKDAEGKIERLEGELERARKQRDQATAEMNKMRKAGNVRSWEL